VTPNAAVPTGAENIDSLSDVNGNHIAFARENTIAGSRVPMVFDVVTHSMIQIGSGTQAGAMAVGGDTIAFVNNSALSDILVGRISDPGAPLTVLSATPDNDKTPAVSPAGDVVVWASCSGFSCSVMKSVHSGSGWSAPSVVRAAPAANPDLDGASIVYDSGGDIYHQPVGGGSETQLELDGVERNPSISEGIIAFESAVSGGLPADLYVYEIATNRYFRVTDTPFIDETLNDITVLPNGDVRMVWAADDDASQAFARNIYARTFTLASTYHFAGFFQPVDNLPALNLATAGRSIPVKFSLGGNQGLAIFEPGYPASGPIPCEATEAGADIEETVTAGASDLSYNASSDQYTYVWKTEKTWKGTCRMLVVGFSDGLQTFAKFRFK
jgi:hypothetical protein